METDVSKVKLTTASTLSQKRSRKLVSRLSEVYDKSFESQSERRHKPVSGTGVKLGDILRIQNAYQRGKLTGELAKNVHSICYRLKGKASRRVTAIKHFNGFELDELDKRVSATEKLKVDELKLIADLLNVPLVASTGKKELARSIVEYLQCPFETGSVVFRSTALKQRRRLGGAVSSKTRLLATIRHGKRARQRLARPAVSPDHSDTLSAAAVASGCQSPPPQQQQIQELLDDGFDEMLDESELRIKIEAVLRVVDVESTSVNQVVDRVLEQLPDATSMAAVSGRRRQRVKKLVKQVICEHVQI